MVSEEPIAFFGRAKHDRSGPEATKTRSISSSDRPALATAALAALAARSEAFSLSSMIRRSRIPVRAVIHSSLVSTIFSRSKLVNTRSGTVVPMPSMSLLTTGAVQSIP